MVIQIASEIKNEKKKTIFYYSIYILGHLFQCRDFFIHS